MANRFAVATFPCRGLISWPTVHAASTAARKRGSRRTAVVASARRTTRLLLPAAALLMLAVPGLATAEWTLQAGGDASYDDNVNNAATPDIRTDSSVRADLSLGQLWLVGEGLFITARLQGDVTAFEHYTGLGSASLGGAMSVRQKFGLGAAAPWISWDAAASHRSFIDDVRDGWQFRSGLASGTTVGDQVDVSLFYAWERRTADHADGVLAGIAGDVFDQSDHAIGLRSAFRLGENWTLVAGFTRRKGNFDQTTPAGPNEDLDEAMAVTRDPAFGPSEFAQKIDAIAHLAEVSLSWAIGSQSSISAGLKRQLIYETTGDFYQKSIVELSYRYAF